MHEYRTRLISDVITCKVDMRGIESSEITENELQVRDEDTANTEDMIDDTRNMKVQK